MKNYHNTFHLEPQTGFLNDPNGLIYYKGVYHIFFQYTPSFYTTGVKDTSWAHYETKDFNKYQYKGIVLKPDSYLDSDGCYSGCAIVKNDKISLFYTGNVKLKGDYDYIYNGRKAYEIKADLDGNKTVLLDNSDYPVDVTCHVRDPKLYEENGKAYMVLGARNINNYGEILVYESNDCNSFKFYNRYTTAKPFGYMWECPDLYKIDNHYVLSICPQGIDKKDDMYQNIYSQGYFLDKIDSSNFIEWDKGFDFYAPQSFFDGKRRIMIGWAGMGDTPYKYLEANYGWCHCHTVPREITYKDNKLYTYPIKEILALAKDDYNGSNAFIVKFNANNKKFNINLNDAFILSYNCSKIELTGTNQYSALRDKRIININEVNEVLILVDTSIIEIYINKGLYAMTTRCYSDKNSFSIDNNEINVEIKDMKPFEVIL